MKKILAGALAVGAGTAVYLSSQSSPAPALYTNTVAWNSGIGWSNRVGQVQSATNLHGPWSNVYSFAMDGSDRVVRFTTTLPVRFYRLAWNTNDLAR